MHDEDAPGDTDAEDEPFGRPVPVDEQVGLALRARRRTLGLSQRAYAERVGRSKSMIARLESAAGELSFDQVVAALAEAGFGLAVTGGDEPSWCETDLVARTRGGSRFPAHLEVHVTEYGPAWWWLDEMMRPKRRLRPAPRWSAERGEQQWRLRPERFFYGQPRPGAQDEGSPE